MAAYLCWLLWPLIAGRGDGDDATLTHLTISKALLFGIILLLDIVQELGSIANRFVVERDWVPVLVGPITPDMKYSLTQVNAVMRRIDFICKLVAPSLLPVVIAGFDSMAAWIILLAASTLVLWGLEITCAVVIARENAELRLPKKTPDNERETEGHIVQDSSETAGYELRSWPPGVYTMIVQEPIVRLKNYFSMEVWPASISVSLIQLTVLAYSATLITYLLEVGFSLTAITIARASGAITALASTFITPMAVGYLRRRRTNHGNEEDRQDDAGEAVIVRSVGLWGITSQCLSLVRILKSSRSRL